jgi:hypothetical protein
MLFPMDPVNTVLLAKGGFVRSTTIFETLRALVIGGACVLTAAAIASAQGRQGTGETYTADASVKRANGSMTSAKLTATIRSWSTDAERDALMAAVKAGGTAARDLLAKHADVGSIQVGAAPTPVKYAYARAVGSGRLITVVTAQPIHYVGGDAPNAKPKAGYDLGLVLMQIDGSAPGTGEVAPAAKVKVDDKGAIVTEDYGADAVRLTNVVKK